MEEVGIIKYQSSAAVFKLLDTWTTNSITSELIKFENDIKEFIIYRNTPIELYPGYLKVDGKVITLEKSIRSIKAFQDIIVGICGNNLFLISASMGRSTVLAGHSSRVRDYCFFRDKLFSVSEDRTLKIWNLKTYVCEFTSSIISKAPLATVDVDNDGLRVVVADEDNVVFFFELTHGNRLKELRKIGIEKFFQSKEVF